MSEKTEKQLIPKEVNRVVHRNDTDLELTETVFGKKSDKKAGVPFLTPVLTESNWDTAVQWIGRDQICTVVNRDLRRVFGTIATDPYNYNEDGTVNWDKMRGDWEDFSAGMPKLSDLQDQIADLQDQQQALALDDQFGETDDNGQKTERAVEIEDQLRKIAETVKPLKKQLADIKAKYAARAEAREKNKENSETKTPEMANA